MISQRILNEWTDVVGWPDDRQLELDLIISRVLVCIFSDQFLREQLRFRGGTALNKIHFPVPYRFSEDIDLVRTTSGPVGPILHHLRECLQPWLGKPDIRRGYFLVVLRFSIPIREDSIIKLKIEINTRELEIHDKPTLRKFKIENSWFSGEANIPTYSIEEILATKLRALLNRNKGRDRFDLGHAMNVFEDLNLSLLVELFQKYSLAANEPISKAQAQDRMIWKYRITVLTDDIIALLPTAEAEQLSIPAAREVFWQVFDNIIDLIPGEDWAKTATFVSKHR